ncbi:thioredoxin domain-containing protein [uncultured Kordia sp.]|uniref:thioredoxin domain-containing protein n=1 Tax=uncultured Kordia sp. TaxID=507699 RepID=UPI002620B37C|nr:thioredoxin domain-containing protein [uncultured Kordia sp.]
MKKFKCYAIAVLITSVLGCVSKTDTNHVNEHQYTNELIHETSPYLLQHAHNPVNWKSWNPKALAQAKEENKLIIISIGYSACHWCHVMEDESFKNDSVAKLMNDKFVSIKIDKEERPDIDQVYMNAVQLMTGSGGWPLNCITLPDGRPIFGGTYFTKRQWMGALNDISSLYEKNPEKVMEYAEKLTEGIQKSELITLNKEAAPFNLETIQSYVKTWNSYLDFNKGGQKTQLKFPMPTNLKFQLRYGIQHTDEKVQSYVNTTLKMMAYGGIYDQIGGGFSRYSTDKKWHVPHFEKMLYDNAQLVSLYSESYLATKNELHKDIVTETLTFINRELTTTNGAFYSSLDADSMTATNELEEGAFYRWTKAELEVILKEDFELFKKFYNVNSYGKWEDNYYVLIRKESKVDFAAKNNLDLDTLSAKIQNWKKSLFEAREQRAKPRLDDKVLTSWNALMLKGYVDAYRAFGNAEYLEAAKKNAHFIIQNQLRTDGGLNHNYKDGKSSINGYLEDYAAVIESFIALYQVTFDEAWLQKAKELTNYTQTHFKDEKTQMFYFTSDTDTNLIARKTEVNDNVIPASNSIMANNLFKLSHYYSNKEYENQAKQMLTNMIPNIGNSPSSYSNWLQLMSNYTSPYFEVAIAGSEGLEKMQQLNTYYLPNILVAGTMSESTIPLLQNRFIEDGTYIYVCVNGTCKLPLTEVEKSIELIK